MRLLALAGCLFLCSTQTWATTLEVSRVQMPAWVQRGGQIKPLTPGLELRSDDIVQTGPGARALLRMGEGSNIKLGENAKLSLANLGITAEDKGLFRASLNVLQGAFRFTTDKLLKTQRRDVTIRIASVTAGIRGTDLWGKAAADKDIVCLIEGHIAVGKEDLPVVEMKDPLSFYIAPKNAAPLPVAPVPPEKLKQWATETEIAEGQAILNNNGRWGLNVLAVSTQNEALAWYDKLRNAGYPAYIRTTKTGKKTHYNLRISGLNDEQGTYALAERLKQDFGVTEQTIFTR